MADDLIFPIKFDLDKAVEQAKGEWSGVQKKMETMIASKPLRVPIVIEQSKELLDAEGNIKAATGSIKAMRAEMASLIKRWEELSQAERLTTDSNGKFIGEAGQIINRFAELTAASRTYARSLSELQSAADKAVSIQERSLQKQQAEDEKRYQQWLALKDKEVQQTEAAEIKKENARRRAIAKQNETQRKREDARYDAYWKQAEKEAAKVEAAEVKKRAAYAASASAQRQAAHEQAQAAFKIAQALKAQETSLDAINAKLQIYQQQIRGQQVGSNEWNKSALEIRRLTEELQKASTQMTDFQQKSFKGLSDSLTVGNVQALTQYRNELAKVEAEFNKLNQTGAAYDSKGGLTQAANNILKQRQDIIKNINQMLTTAADAQMQREKEINRIIEQRKAKADAIAAKRKAEQADIQSNIAKLKEERRILNQQESSIANITAKLQIQQQRLQSAKLGSAEFTKTAKEVERLTIKLEQAKRKVDEVTGRVVSGARQQVAAHKQVTQELGNHSSYLQRLTQRMAAYWSIRQVGNFLSNVREVTAQFELQRVSLGAIIQDQQRANALFSEIKSFALKSPVSIMDLTKYTKQLAAYKIETEELFETTKKLTDVSVGLGVSMDRVVLAYGQVRARGALYASEIRQFTEMGVPIVEELAAKLSKMNGELVTSKDVLEQVSKGAISFELVKEVFDDMTSAGGMFYNMQEKQGNTLFGLWAKLGDAASVMYDQIGNTESVNKGMKDAIQLLTSLMRNWRDVGRNIAEVAVGFAAFKTIMAAVAVVQRKSTALMSADIAVRQRYNSVVISNSTVLRKFSGALTMFGVSEQRAIALTRGMVLSVRALGVALKSALITTGIGAVVVALGYMADKLLFAKSEAERLNEEMTKITAETSTLQSQSVQNFTSLANAAVNAADGSKAQRDALDELVRTYKSVIPEQDLTIEKLRAMKGDYDALTESIRENIYQQQLQKGIDTISESYGIKMKDATDDLKKQLKDLEGLNDEQVGRIISTFRKLTDEGKDTKTSIGEIFTTEGISEVHSGTITAFENLSNVVKNLNSDVSKLKGSMSTTKTDLKDLAKYLDEAKALFESRDVKAEKGTFEFDVEQAKANAGLYLRAFQKAFDEAGVKIDLSKYVELTPEGLSIVNWDALFKVVDKVEGEYKIPLQNFGKEVQEAIDNFIPKEHYVRFAQARFKQILDGTVSVSAENRGVLKQYMMKSGEDWDTYTKRIKDALDSEIQKQKELRKEREKTAAWGLAGSVFAFGIKEEQKKNDEEVKFLQELWKSFKPFKTPKKGDKGGKKDDPRLSILNEMVSTLKQVNKEYDDLAKKEGNTKALADTQKIYADTFKNMQKLAKQYKFALPDFGVPTDTASLTKYLEAIKKAMAKLPKSQKAVLALQVDIAKLDTDEKQKQIEEELKRLAEKISRTKTAQEFYDKILSTTGDLDLAANVTMSIYGDAGTDVQAQMAEYISSLFGGVDLEVPVSIITSEGVIDYTALEKFATENKKILGDSYKELIKIAQDGQKDMAKTYEGYLKDLEVAKTFADKRIELARDTANKINEIEKTRAEAQKKLDELVSSGKTDKDTQDEIKRLEAQIKAYSELPARYTEREIREAAKLEYEAFKDTPLYTQMFEDLDYASSSALTRMRDKLTALKDQWKNLDPKNIKEMQKRLDEIDSQLASRNPFKTLADAYKKWRDMRKSGRTKEGDEVAAVNAEKERKAAWDKMMADEKAYELAVKTHGEKSKEAQAARKVADASKETYENAEKGADEAANNANEWKKIADKARKAAGAIRGYTEKINEAADGIRGMLDAFGASEEDKQFFEDIVGGFNKISKGGEQAAESFARFSSGDIFGGITAGVGAVGNIVSGFTDLFSAGRVRKANKEIKRQQELLEQLQYTYSRLEYAADKAFGRDYVNNYQQQIKNLQAQQQAYLKQAEAERSKGKKKDEEKIKEYENAARDTADEIKKMQDDLVAHFTGSSKTDVARQMAKSWIDARASMSDTFAAIKGDYQDLIKNMIVEGAAARVIENALTPVWDSMEKMLEKNDVQGAIDSLIGGMDAALSQANNGMEVLWKALEARGYDMKKMLGTSDTEMTGIAKSVAGATSEEINNVAAIGNTLMYYVSPIPRMDENLAAIRSLMEAGGGGATTAVTTAGWTDWQQQAMDNYNAIARNTAETVTECRRSAQACESIAAQFSRIIKVKGSITGVNTFLNS